MKPVAVYAGNIGYSREMSCPAFSVLFASLWFNVFSGSRINFRKRPGVEQLKNRNNHRDAKSTEMDIAAWTEIK
jgi:hypothetical protein